MENFMEIVPGEPVRRGSWTILDLLKAISLKRCKVGGKLVLITNRKSYMRFRLVPKSVTLHDLERRNGSYFALFRQIYVHVQCRHKTISSVSKSTFDSLW